MEKIESDRDHFASARAKADGKYSSPEEISEYPLSHNQRALWLAQQMRPESAAYNVVYAARLTRALNIHAFHRAFQKLVDRHPVLRATFAATRGEPAQFVHSRQEACFRVEDATDWSPSRLSQALADAVHCPFKLDQGPLARVRLFRQADLGYTAVLAMHHSITDMWSLAIFMYELGVLYTAEDTGAQPPLKPLKATYADFVQTQSEMLAGPDGERLRAYWESQLAGELPVLNLPSDRPRPAVQTYRGATQSVMLSAELMRRLKSVAEAQSATLFMISLAAFQTLLHRYTGQDDILVATPKACRDRKFARVLGYFVNPVVMRANLSGNPKFSDFLAQVRQTVTEGFENGDYPYSLLAERLRVARDPGQPALFQVVLAWQKTTSLVSQDMTKFALNDKGGQLDVGELSYESTSLEHRVAPFEITLQMGAVGDELGATIEYNADLFDAATISRMLGHFQTLLEGIAVDPERRISDLPLLTAAERQQLLEVWNTTAAAYPLDQCAHHLFEQWVDCAPDAIAVTFSGAELSYLELNRRANKVAHYLRKVGVGPEALVGVCVDRSVEMIVAVLGVLKAGGAYLPLDPNYRRERLAFMLGDSRPAVLLTQQRLDERLRIADCGLRIADETAQSPISNFQSPIRNPQSAIRNPLVVCLDADWGIIARESDENPQGQPLTRGSAAIAGNLAYVIYTSGSTGQPKGGMLEHRGLCNLAAFQRRAFGVGAGSRVLQFAPLSFDASVWEMFMALGAGATLCLARQEQLASMTELNRLLREQAITTVTLPPSALSNLSPEGLPVLATVIAAGESCSRELAAKWGQGRRFFNAYGPTETTVCAAMALCDEKNERNPPIGRPIANTQLYILNTHLQPAPAGVAGELFIGGVGVARGYLNRPELTAEKFIPDPFSAEPGGRLYKTGDLVRYLRDGNIEFLGRADQQVKIRGFRIELGEIEAALTTHPAIREAVVEALSQPGPGGGEDVTGEKRLVAYIVSDAKEAPSAGALRSFLKERLPEYMTPSIFVPMDAFPLTPSGKVDRKRLPVPTGDRPNLEADYVTPRTDLEKVIAEVWKEALNLEKVGAHDNFFDLGGHSLTMAKVHCKLQEKLGREISMIEMFKCATVSALSKYLSHGETEQPTSQKANEHAARQRAAIELG
ncbi:MAG: amino acid adenylation domain-containing protein [Blastocatellales bacterium]